MKIYDENAIDWAAAARHGISRKMLKESGFLAHSFGRRFNAGYSSAVGFCRHRATYGRKYHN